MAFVYAFLISGCICALTQCLSSLKVPFPLVAILLMVLGGGLCTKLGFLDWLNALSAAGLAVTAVGCGNGAYNAGVALAAVGTAQPLLLTAALNVILVGLGAGVVSACTNIAMKVKLDETGEEYAFAFPYSFKQFFTAEDPALQQEILDFYDSGAWVAPIHDHYDC